MVSRKYLLLTGFFVVAGLCALLPGTQRDGKLDGALSPPDTPVVSRDSVPAPQPADRPTSSPPGEVADVQEPAIRSQSPLQPPAGSPLIAIENGEVTLDVTKYPLQTILHEITRKSGIPIFFADTLDNPLVTIRFEKLPIARGLDRLLKTFDVFYFHRGGAAESASIGAVWVYPEGAGTEIVPVPASEWASTREMAESINASDPNMRAQALETLVEREGDEALDLVIQALKDPDEVVRYRILNKALAAGLTVPAEIVLDLLKSDESFNMRSIALGAVAQDTSTASQWLQTVAEVAARDPSPELRELALEIVNQTETAGRSRDGDENLQPKEAQGREELPVESGPPN